MLYYAYEANPTNDTFETTAMMESNKYRIGGPQDVESTDGGTTSYLYEKGTNLTLNPINDSGLVGYWKFDEGTGTSAGDSSGNNNNGSWTGGTPHYASGKVGLWAGNFNGTIGNGVSTGLNLAGLSAFSESFWFNMSATTVGLLANQWGGVASTGMMNNGSIIVFSVSTSGGTNNSYTSLPPLNTWTYVTGVYTGSSVSLYINGVFISNRSLTGTVLNNGYNTLIGERYDGQLPFSGLIDDVRIYNRALSPAEILSLYNATK